MKFGRSSVECSEFFNIRLRLRRKGRAFSFQSAPNSLGSLNGITMRRCRNEVNLTFFIIRAGGLTTRRPTTIGKSNGYPNLVVSVHCSLFSSLLNMPTLSSAKLRVSLMPFYKLLPRIERQHSYLANHICDACYLMFMLRLK